MPIMATSAAAVVGIAITTSVFVSPRAARAAAADPDVTAADIRSEPTGKQRALLGPLDCGFKGPEYWESEIRKAVARGEIADPKTRQLPELPAPQRRLTGPAQCLTPEHIFLHEDTKLILLSDFSSAQLIDLMVTAANNVLATYGDNYDFIGFWVNFQPHHEIGAAFYKLISNDVQGIGNVGAPVGRGPIFDLHRDLGLAGEQMQGMVMMWNIDHGYWQPGDGEDAAFTRLVLGQEFEHRFALFLPALLDDRVLQGDNSGCGRVFHWNWKVDGQGSAMEISEWIGSNPADRVGSSISFNTDTGGVFSYTDLYIMGYVSPEEMDLGNSELRFMDDSDCSPSYFGPISKFASSDIIASAGERIPSSKDSQKDFRTAWIMIHLPGAPPTDPQLDKVVAILQQHTLDWHFSTLNRGTMDNALFEDCNCNGIPDADDIAGGNSDDSNGNGIPDECECLWDLDNNGTVGASDLLSLLVQWGTDPGGPPDFDGDGNVGASDLLTLLVNWGPCP
ncbi:MAG: hypothetical protein V3T84_16400 [Phycisphaerales bacterium]